MTDQEQPTSNAGGPAPQRRLDRAPGERYRGSVPPRSGGGPAVDASNAPVATPAGSVGRGILLAVGLAVIAAVARAVAGQVDLGIGTLVIGTFVGWVVALALVWGAGGRRFRRRAVVAAALGGGAILVGVLLEWALARAGTGVLGPLDYIDQRYGVVAWLEIALAATVAGIRAR